MMKRRSFLKFSGSLAATSLFMNRLSSAGSTAARKEIITVDGPIKASKAGFTLTHEHVLVDFIGADAYNPSRWDDEEVLDVVTPYLNEIRERGCDTLVECTPEYIGRDPVLLRKLSERTGLQILTNTGYYGASNNKYIPAYAYSETAEQLAERWIRDFRNGIGETGIRPGFMKIGVAPESLSRLHKKLITAAGLTHQETGMPIASHTGPAIPAFEQITELGRLQIAPENFIWVHAQNETDDEQRLRAARMGAWVSLDGVNEQNIDQYVSWLKLFKEEQLMHRVLVSHDAGWYSPGETGGGDFRPFTTIFDDLIPALSDAGFKKSEIDRLFIDNPAEAFTLRFRN